MFDEPFTRPFIEKYRPILKVSLIYMNEFPKVAESRLFKGCTKILEVWTIWRPPEAV